MTRSDDADELDEFELELRQLEGVTAVGFSDDTGVLVVHLLARGGDVERAHAERLRGPEALLLAGP